MTRLVLYELFVAARVLGCVGGWGWVGRGGVAGVGKGESLMLAETRVGKNNNSFSETGFQQAYEAKM